MGDTGGMIEGMAQEKGQSSPEKEGEHAARYAPDAREMSGGRETLTFVSGSPIPLAADALPDWLGIPRNIAADSWVDMAASVRALMAPSAINAQSAIGAVLGGKGLPGRGGVSPTNPQPSGRVSPGARRSELEERTSGEFAAADIITVASILGFSEPTAGQASVLADELADLRKRMLSKLEWESLAGPIVEAGEILRLTGWTRQSLSKAVKQHRVLRLIGSNGRTAYPRDLFTGSPARPLEGIKPVLEAWKDADGWSTLSWLVSENADLESRTPREVLEKGSSSDREKVAALAAEAARRMQ